MLLGNLGLVSNKTRWQGFYTPLDVENEDEIDITEATEITLCVRDADSKSIKLTGSLSTGEITLVSDTTFAWLFTKTQMSALCARTYEVGATIQFDDDDAQLIIGTVSVLDGIVS